jgi:hypothetical protein
VQVVNWRSADEDKEDAAIAAGSLVASDQVDVGLSSCSDHKPTLTKLAIELLDELPFSAWPPQGGEHPDSEGIMAWIESHQELDDHPKTRKAAALLGISVVTMVGHLHILWHWALSYAQDGDLTGFLPEDIAIGAKWDDDPERFVNALVNCKLGANKAGFVERTADGDLVLHDWWEYAGKYVAKRQADAERKRLDREAAAAERKAPAGGKPAAPARTSPGVQQTSNGRLADGAGRVPNSTIPNHTIPESTEPGESEAAPPPPPPLPPQIEIYEINGGRYQSGNLTDGTPRKDRARQYIEAHVTADPDSLDFWGKVVAAYCMNWSPRSYQVMVNDYYEQGRLPAGTPKNGKGTAIAPANGPPGKGNNKLRRVLERKARERGELN